MRISDWSSVVCSSDLGARPRARLEQFADHGDVRQQRHALDRPALIVVEQPADREDLPVLCGQRRLELALVEDERSEEHTSELQSLMRISYAVFCLKKKKETI